VGYKLANRRPLFTFGKRKISIYSFYCYSGSCSNNFLRSSFGYRN
jgi:hypothetical protein